MLLHRCDAEKLSWKCIETFVLWVWFCLTFGSKSKEGRFEEEVTQQSSKLFTGFLRRAEHDKLGSFLTFLKNQATILAGKINLLKFEKLLQSIIGILYNRSQHHNINIKYKTVTYTYF